jgi:hypothetical protein
VLSAADAYYPATLAAPSNGSGLSGPTAAQVNNLLSSAAAATNLPSIGGLSTSEGSLLSKGLFA